MAEVTFSVPGMYADHHVSAVTEALKGLAGVGNVVASSLRKKVTVTYDPGQVSPEKIEAALRSAGYAPESAEGAITEEVLSIRKISTG